MKSESIPVIIRVEGDSRRSKQTAHRDDVVAFFPTEPGTYDPRTMSCYSHAGQHSTCEVGYIGSETRKASRSEVAMMLKELRAVGYRNLKVVARASSQHARARRAALR